MSRTPLFDSLKEYERRSRGYFRIPGHRFERGIPETFRAFAGDGIFKLDVTETALSDDLHNPKTVIAESLKYTAEAFGATESFYLVNGTTCGNQSMILAGSGEGEKILIPRNAHKSVLSGLIMSGAVPVYYQAPVIKEIGVIGAADPKEIQKILDSTPDLKAVFAVSPSYHGFCTDLKTIAEAVHQKKIPLLVDEAHGAHLYFSNLLPEGALNLGADACAQSLHKTAGALTQSSLLHLGSSFLDRTRIDSALRMTMSTSPSYILMSSLELARHDLETRGEEYWMAAISLTEELKQNINDIEGFRIPEEGGILTAGVHAIDPSRILVNCDESSLSGYELKEILWDRHGIDVEMADQRNILALVSYGNTKEEKDNFLEALGDISRTQVSTGKTRTAYSGAKEISIPEMALTPREAYFSETRSIPWNDMRGKIAGEMAAPYPPGIPLIYPGEIITAEIADILDEVKQNRRHLHGISDPDLSSIRICDFY